MVELISLAQEKALLNACRVLFGPETLLTRDFLACLQIDGVRSAYLNQAKLSHPDRFPGAGLAFLQRKADRFRRVATAYDLLNDFLGDRERGLRFYGRAGGANNFGSSGARPSSRNRVQRSRRPCDFRSFSEKKYLSSAGFKLPRRPLPLGLYLNYRGLISHSDIAKALVWQRQQRPRLGELSRRWGRLEGFEVEQILKARHQGLSRFGEKAVALGMLSQFQVDTMIYFQRSKQRPLGEFFVEKGVISNSLIEKLVAELHDHNEKALLDTPLLRRFLGIFF